MREKFIGATIFFLRYFWAVYTFLIPLSFFHLPVDFFRVGYERELLTIFFCCVGFLLELLLHPHLHFTDLRKFKSFFIQNRILALVSLFAIWGIFSSFFSTEPAIALTGVLNFGGDGSLWYLCLSFLFFLIYIRALYDKFFLGTITRAFILSGFAIAILAIIEFVNQNTMISFAQPSDLPVLMYPQKGHLGVVLSIFIAVSLFSYQKSNMIRNVLMLFIILITSFGLGITGNRSVYLVFGLIFLFIVYKKQNVLVFCTALAFFHLGFMGLSLGTSGTKELSNAFTLQTRLYMVKSGLNGILAKPIFGWGAGEFQTQWANFLKKEDLTQFMRMEFRHEYLSHINNIFIVAYETTVNGVVQAKGQYLVRAFKVHNQFLEIGILRGIPGLVMYVLILVMLIRRANPWSVAVISFHGVLMLWFLTNQSDAILWLAMGAAAASTQLQINQERKTNTLLDSASS
jgi:O-antigen ligase